MDPKSVSFEKAPKNTVCVQFLWESIQYSSHNVYFRDFQKGQLYTKGMVKFQPCFASRTWLQWSWDLKIEYDVTQTPTNPWLKAIWLAVTPLKIIDTEHSF